MDTKDLISIQQFCMHYNVPDSFINALHDYELIEITVRKNERYLKITHINDLEKMIRLHFELNINLEGLDVVYNLLNQVESLQNEVKLLKNRLNIYEDN